MRTGRGADRDVDPRAFYRLLLGAVTAKVLQESPCPVWTGAHLEDPRSHEFSVRRVLCSVDLTPHNRHTLSQAAEAKAVDAVLTLVRVTPSLEISGPGGFHVDPAWKETIVGIAAEQIAKLQRDEGTDAEVIIDSGCASGSIR